MQVLTSRRDVIQWAGAVRAYPILRGDQPDLSRPGEDEAGAQRIGWRDFFAPMRRRKLVVVVEAADKFEHRVMEEGKARAELPAAAFGPPLMARVWHEVMLEKPTAQ